MGGQGISSLNYEPKNFSDLADTPLAREIWDFLKTDENIIRMETATFLERSAVEPLAPHLVHHFGPEIGQDRLKQMIGHMTRQIMETLGYEIDRQTLRITRPSLFTTAARYRRPSDVRDRSMKITREQRQCWLEKTANSEFNRWLDKQVKDHEGRLNLGKLYQVAASFGIDNRYDHLNPGQQRMTLGGMLRKRVPMTLYANED